jgi:hypothetical protein
LKHTVSRVAYFAVVLWCAAGCSLFLLASIAMAAPPGRQQDENRAPRDQPTADGAQQTPATAADAAKPAAKPKRVITNDDIKSSPYTGFGGLFYTNSGSINDCDANCFDQVRASAQVDAEKNPNWRRDVLHELELVRSDSEWQAYLHDLYDAHRKVCQVTFDKTDEMRVSGNTRNLGPQEIAITEKYDAQMKTAQAELSAAVARQFMLQKKFADQPYANSFAAIQGTRMQGGFCSQARVIYAR